jgi:hypothetical protein
VESWKWRGRFYLQRWPSARALGVLRDKVRAVTASSRTERPVAAVVAELNPVLRGWAGYFRNGNSGRKFNAVDGYVHERLAIFASRKHGLATATSMSGWRSSPAGSTASRAGTGPPATPMGGSAGSGSSA